MKLKNALLALFALGTATVQAQTFYSQSTKDINAGVLVVRSNTVFGVPANNAPFAWYYLDNDFTTKPLGWNLVNPLAPARVSSSEASRWSTIATSLTTNGYPTFTPPAAGTAISKNQASYWEVDLTFATQSQINQMDALILPIVKDDLATGILQLNPFEREKLRSFVDKGGVLWIVLSGAATIDPVNAGPLSFGVSTSGTPATLSLDSTSPLLSSPNRITNPRLDRQTALVPPTLASTALRGILSPIELEANNLKVVATSSLGTHLCYAKLGDGYIVIEAGNSSGPAQARFNGTAKESNYAFFAPTTTLASPRFMVNLLSLATSGNNAGVGGRRNSSVAIEASAPVTQTFAAPPTAPVTINPNDPLAPITYKGVTLVSKGTILYCYDADPGTDLDGNGNADDGETDYANGTSYDLIWKYDLGVQISAPSAYEVATATVKDQVAVSAADGTVYVFNVFPKVGGFLTGTVSGPAYTVNPPTLPSVSAASFPTADPENQNGPYAPIFNEGLVYVADLQNALGTVYNGRIWVFNPATGNRVTSAQDFCYGGTGSNAPEFVTSPTVGYIPIQDNSGGMDKVMYLGTRNSVSDPGPNGSAGLISLWLGAKGEKPLDYVVSGGVLQITTRASLNSLKVYVSNDQTQPDPLGVKITLLRDTGVPYTEADMAGVFSGTVSDPGSGILQVPLAAASLPADVSGIRVDYTIDWGVNSSVGANILRGSLNFPDSSNHNKRILGNLALAPNGTVFASVGSTNEVSGSTVDANKIGGAVYALQESGRGSFKLVYRYELYDDHNITLGQGGVANYGPLFKDFDSVGDLVGAAAPVNLSGADIQFLTLHSGPTVRGDNVYVTARAQKSATGVPVTVLLSFKTAPDPVEIRIPGEIPPLFAIIQPDISSSVNKTTQPERMTIIQPGQYSYSKELSASYGIIRFDNLMATTRGPITNALSTSQPIILRQSGLPDRLIDPDVEGRWSPLNWYMIFPAMDKPTQPVAMGDSVLFGAENTLFTGTAKGMFLGVRNPLSETDSYLLTTDKPARRQFLQLLNSGTVTSNPSVITPQLPSELSVPADYLNAFSSNILFLNGATAPAPTSINIGENAVFLSNGAGLFRVSQSDILVADQDRLARYDSLGTPIWTLETKQEGDTSPTLRKALVEPVRAFKNGNQTWVVDAGANALYSLGTDGSILRSKIGYTYPYSTAVFTGKPGESKNFNQPADMTQWNAYVDANLVPTNPSSGGNLFEFTLVADKGNGRLILLGMDSTGENQLIWHSPANLSGPDFDYNTVVRLPATPASSGQPVILASTSRAIYVFLGDTNPVFLKKIEKIQIPNGATNAFFNPDTSLFDLPLTAQTHSLQGVRSVSATWVDSASGPVLAVMVADNNGVYEIDATDLATFAVRWMLPQEVYQHLRGVSAGTTPIGTNFTTGHPKNPRAFFPTYAKRLRNGNVMVVNSFTGRTLGDSTFGGEILEVDGAITANPLTDTNSVPGFGFNKTNLGFGYERIRSAFSTIRGARALQAPVFALRN